MSNMLKQNKIERMINDFIHDQSGGMIEVRKLGGDTMLGVCTTVSFTTGSGVDATQVVQVADPPTCLVVNISRLARRIVEDL